jgi:hypothetical protein
MALTAPEICLPGSRVMPAGLKKIVLAFSAAAAWPAYALPIPLAFCSINANPDALASADPPAIAAATYI